MSDRLASIRPLVADALSGGEPMHAVPLLGQLAGKEPEAGMLLGVAYSLSHRHGEAVRLLESAAARAPEDPAARFNLGLARERAGDRPGAEAAYRETLRLAPTHPGAWARLENPGEVRNTSFSLALPVPARPVASGAAGTSLCPRCGTASTRAVACAGCGALLTREEPQAVVMDESSGMTGPQALGLRWAACLVDHALVGAVWVAVALALHAELVPRFGQYETLVGCARLYKLSLVFGPAYAALTPMAAIPTLPRWLAIAAYYLLFITYDTVMHARTGQTLGKRLLGLRVTDIWGKPVGWKRAFFRATVGRLLADCPILFVTLVNTCLGYAWVLMDDEQRGWHDRICGTRVLKR